MDLTTQSHQLLSSFGIAQNLTIAGNAEVVNILTFGADFAKAIIPNGTQPTGYAEIFKPGHYPGEALLSTKPPRIMAINQTAGTVGGLPAYSVAVEQWDNGFTVAAGDIVVFTPATNPLPTTPYLAGAATNLSSSFIESETVLRQLFRDVIRATINANNAIQAAYPIGSIYINASSSTNPSTLLGFGTWVEFGAGRVPVGIDATQTEFDVLEETGGANTHVLAASEIPEHRHQIGALIADAVGANITTQSFIKTGTPINSNVQQSGYFGGGAGTAGSKPTDPHNNLQPYIVVQMWKRTA